MKTFFAACALQVVLVGALVAGRYASAAEPGSLQDLLPVAPACGAADAGIPAGAESPGSLVPALYEIVSGAAGTARDWDRLRSLHAPGARITPTRHLPDGGFAARPGTIEEFVRLNEQLFADRGFFEVEIAQRIESFGHVAHVMSTYESRLEPDGPAYARGVNSFQLLNDGRRWCVLSATWDGEIPAHPIPANYLPPPAP